MNLSRRKDRPLAGPMAVIRAFAWMFRPAVGKWVLIPLLINLSLFALAFWMLYQKIGGWIDWLIPDILELFSALLWPILVLGILIILFYVSSILANLIAAPFNQYLSRAVAREMGLEDKLESENNSLLNEIAQAFGAEIRKLIYLSSRAVPLLVLFLIPVLNIAAPFLWLLFAAWALAVEYADYPLGLSGVKFDELRSMLGEQRFMSLGFGGSVLFLTLTPVLNFIAMPVAVIAATLLWVEDS